MQHENENISDYTAFSRRCFALGQKLDLDVWDSDVDELWDADAQKLDDTALGEKLREYHLR